MSTTKEQEQIQRILWMVQQAKRAAELVGDVVPSDETILRAASAIELVDQQRERFDQYDDGDDMAKLVSVMIVAASFTGDHPLVELLAKKEQCIAMTGGGE